MVEDGDLSQKEVLLRPLTVCTVVIEVIIICKMIFFYNNFDLNVNWQQAYTELNLRYAQLHSNYMQAL